MSALTDDELDLHEVEEWNLPQDADGFLEWMTGAVPGLGNQIRLWNFVQLPVARLMPPKLKAELERRSLTLERPSRTP